MYKTIVIGGGFSGCAAAVAARKAGSEVMLLEKTDLLLGLGNVGGIMRNNGRYTAAEENIAMGAGEIFDITDRYSLHKNIDFPGHEHASFFDVINVEPAVRELLEGMDIQVRMMSRVIDVEMEDPGRISGVTLPSGEFIRGDVFVETTGSTGPMGNCVAYGNGCSMCVLRCPSFGPRVSISQRAGVPDISGKRKNGIPGAFSGSGKLEKASLSTELQNELNENGVAVVPLPKEKIVREKLDMKVCRQYALDEYAENIILLDTGHAKLMSPYFPIEHLRTIPGFEKARYVDPYAGGKGNSIRYVSVTERDNSMKVKGLDNLFCGGEKAGLFVGHTEAIATGSLAGYNAVRSAAGKELLELPDKTVTGDLIAYGNEQIKTEEGLRNRYTFAGAEFFERMKERKLYSTDRKEIKRRIRRLGLENIYGSGI